MAYNYPQPSPEIESPQSANRTSNVYAALVREAWEEATPKFIARQRPGMFRSWTEAILFILQASVLAVLFWSFIWLAFAIL